MMPYTLHRILKRHNDLLQEHYSSSFSGEIDIESVKEFVDELQKSGSKLNRSYERDQVRSLYRFWLNYIYRCEKSTGDHALYLIDDIFPYAGAPLRPRAAFTWLGITFLLVILFALLSFNIFQNNLTQLKETGIPANQENSLVSTLMAASTQTSDRQENEIPTQNKTSHAEPGQYATGQKTAAPTSAILPGNETP